ncbi:murein L,D-transpeptidase catalytic domain family protein [Sphingobacterium sp. E70]|nr:murein L,D-transpeptidase catalytic domain family protein [Sphingobacterium sp. E70]ULT24548.1 murein L,D-transpeptidase catalytic domain family protein [Sphingobacterium sp. E70]
MGNTIMFLLMALNTALSSKEELKTTDQQTNTHHINVERQRTAVDSLYDEMNLGPVLKYEAFRQAMEGRKELSIHNKDIMTVIDFSMASTEKRLVVLDLEHKKCFLTPWYHTEKIVVKIMLQIFRISRNH